MDTRRTTSRNTTALTAAIITAAILIGAVAPAQGQQTLGDMIREGGYEWLMGRWVSPLGRNAEAQLHYRWIVKDRVVGVDFRTDDIQYHGIIFYSPAENRIVEVGADSDGGCAKGHWEPEGLAAVSTATHTDSLGNTERLSFVHSRVDDKTMRIVAYRLDAAGNRTAAQVTMEYKRRPPKPAVRTSGRKSTGVMTAPPRREHRTRATTGVKIEK